MMSPHELSLSEFKKQAAVMALVGCSHKWAIRLGVSFSANSDAATADASLVEVHHRECANAIRMSTFIAPDAETKIPAPTNLVLKDHPDLWAQVASYRVSCADGAVRLAVGIDKALRVAREHMFFTEKDWAAARSRIEGGAAGLIIAYGFAQTGIDMVQDCVEGTNSVMV
ncbi:hypothetical protein ACEN2T_17405 [Pseudomonas sp. W22_MBD1_FP4]|uniref:hypothetical protein n=1 Tax=Pseudomonas sp. W22_MBD1_FP4 TaxID=3240272 RepID=UPI003F989FDD